MMTEEQMKMKNICFIENKYDLLNNNEFIKYWTW